MGVLSTLKHLAFFILLVICVLFLAFVNPEDLFKFIQESISIIRDENIIFGLNVIIGAIFLVLSICLLIFWGFSLWYLYFYMTLIYSILFKNKKTEKDSNASEYKQEKIEEESALK